MYKCSYETLGVPFVSKKKEETLGVRVASIFVEVWLAFVLA
jgi:hypothetical protein